MIEGDLYPGRHIVLIEDLISTGGSSVAAVEALREEGEATVTDVVAIFSYELLASAERAQQFGVRFHPLSTFSDLMDVAVEQGRLTNDEVSLAADFTKDPAGWMA